MSRSKVIILTVAACLLPAGIAPAFAQTKPSCIEGPLTIIVPRSAGGAQDLLSRFVGAQWGKKLGVDVVVDNVAGGSGAVGLVKGHRLPADGRTIVSWVPPGEYILSLQGRIPFRADKEEWELIGSTNADPGLIAVSQNSPYKTLKEVVEASKGDKRLSAATIGLTSSSALEAMLYERLFGVTWGLVPFDSGGDLTTAVLGGHVDLGVREGGIYDLHPEKLRILSVASDKRIAELPDVPTVEEATGQKVTFSATRGFAVRKGTPEPILKCLREAFNEAAKSPEIVDKQFSSISNRYEFLDAAQFTEIAESQYKLAEEFKERMLAK